VNYDGLITFIQNHFTDGLVVVIGSGLSAAEGMSGMSALATHLSGSAASLSGADVDLWSKIKAHLDANEGLEAAMLKHAPTDTLEEWVVRCTCSLLLPEEQRIMKEVVEGTRTLRLTTLLGKILKPPAGLPILTTNYDRLIEVACEIAGYHVDTTAVGHYAGEFDHVRSCMGSCRGLKPGTKYKELDHFPRAVVLKPHGSFDWYEFGGKPRRCTLDLDADRLVITPGLNKYKKGYNTPFDKHRDLANDHIKQAARFCIIGYGFNDDHLQTHLEQRIKGGAPTLILTHTANGKSRSLAEESANCVCVSKVSGGDGVAVLTKDSKFEHQGHNLWDIEVLATEVLS
jgi:hypothetical protein